MGRELMALDRDSVQGAAAQADVVNPAAVGNNAAEDRPRLRGIGLLRPTARAASSGNRG
jgi:hypothetical protein